MAPSSQQYVFVITNQPDLLEYLFKLIGTTGWGKVGVFDDEIKGLEACLKNPPNCVILDLDCRNMETEEICRILRSSRQTRDIPIVVVSQQPATRHREIELLKAGVDVYLESPFLDDEILGALQHLLEGKKEILEEIQPDSSPPIDPQLKMLMEELGYDALEIIGEGGMGLILKARQIRLGRLVAIKLLSPQLQSNKYISKRFHEEARIMASVNHPNIVQIYDVGTHKNTSFFIMEFIEGINLAQKISREPITVAGGISIIKQVSDGLIQLHSKKIIHRDIKPSNIMISRDGIIKIADFGIAGAKLPYGKIGREDTRILIGSPNYMAPEIVDGKQATEHSDQFAFALTVWCMFSRKHPRKSHLPLSEFREDIPEELSSVLSRCMDPDPDFRYRSIKAASVAMLEACGISAHDQINFPSWITQKQGDLFSVPTIITSRKPTETKEEIAPPEPLKPEEPPGELEPPSQEPISPPPPEQEKVQPEPVIIPLEKPEPSRIQFATIRKICIGLLYIFALLSASLTMASMIKRKDLFHGRFRGGMGESPTQIIDAFENAREVSPLPNPRNMHGSVVADGYLYVVSGVETSGLTASVLTAKINKDGTLGEWFENTPLPSCIMYIGNSVVTAKGFIYVCGGHFASEKPGTYELVEVENNSVLYARILEGGRLSPWKQSDPWDNKASVACAAVTDGSRIYVMGGEDLKDRIYDTVFVAPILEGGDLGPWEATMPLPQPLWFHGASVYRNAVYVTGGMPDPNPTNVNSRCFKANIMPHGKLGPWQLLPEMLSKPAYSFASCSLPHNFILICGRTNGRNLLSVVQYSINRKGQWQPWKELPVALPNRLYSSAASDEASGIVYIAGGRSSSNRSSVQDKVFMARMRGNGKKPALAALPGRKKPETRDTVKINSITVDMIGERVTIQGKLTDLRLAWSERAPNILTLTDATGDIDVVYWREDQQPIPESDRPIVNDQYRLTGQVDRYQGNIQVRIRDISDIVRVSTPPPAKIGKGLVPVSDLHSPATPKPVKSKTYSIDRIDQSLVDQYATIRGTISRIVPISGGKLMEISDHTGIITVPFWDKIFENDLRVRYLENGDQVIVRGQVFLYEDRNEVQLKPETCADLEIVR